MQRVSVVGNAGSGKTLLARQLAALLEVPHIELDAIHHLPGWTPIDPATFLSQLDRLTTKGGWVVDGNYREWSWTGRCGDEPTPWSGSTLMRRSGDGRVRPEAKAGCPPVAPDPHLPPAAPA